MFSQHRSSEDLNAHSSHLVTLQAETRERDRAAFLGRAIRRECSAVRDRGDIQFNMYIKREARVERVLRNDCARYGGLKDYGKRVGCLHGNV